MGNPKEEGKGKKKKPESTEKVLEKIMRDNEQLSSALTKILKNSNKPKTEE